MAHRKTYANRLAEAEAANTKRVIEDRDELGERLSAKALATGELKEADDLVEEIERDATEATGWYSTQDYAVAVSAVAALRLRVDHCASQYRIAFDRMKGRHLDTEVVEQVRDRIAAALHLEPAQVHVTSLPLNKIPTPDDIERPIVVIRQVDETESLKTGEIRAQIAVHLYRHALMERINAISARRIFAGSESGSRLEILSARERHDKIDEIRIRVTAEPPALPVLATPSDKDYGNLEMAVNDALAAEFSGSDLDPIVMTSKSLFVNTQAAFYATNGSGSSELDGSQRVTTATCRLALSLKGWRKSTDPAAFVRDLLEGAFVPSLGRIETVTVDPAPSEAEKTPHFQITAVVLSVADSAQPAAA